MVSDRNYIDVKLERREKYDKKQNRKRRKTKDSKNNSAEYKK